MSKKRVKALAVCIIKKEGLHGDLKILVGEGEDPATKQVFYRPLGGSIEFGESARDAVVREFHEELGVTIIEPTQLGVVENIFTYNGQPGHELVLIFEAKLKDVALYHKTSFPRLDKDGRALWMPLADFPAKPLYPAGLLKLLLGRKL